MNNSTNGKTSWLDPKIITSAGGIVVAVLTLYLMFNYLTNVQVQTNAVIKDVSQSIQGNTRAVQALDQYIRDKKN